MTLHRLGRVVGFALSILLVGALTVACGDDDDTTGVTINDLAGTWNGTSVELTWNAMPSVSVDLVQLGLTITLDVETNETYTFTASLAQQPVEVVNGDFNLTGGNSFSLTNDDEPGEVWSGTFTLSGNNLSVRLEDVTLFDFDDDDINDESLMEADFVRGS
jgi:hypothetical protein